MTDTVLRAIITAVDKLSPVLAKQGRMMRGWSRQFEKAGRGAIPMAAGLGAGLALTTRAFMEQEDAVTQLKNTLMTSDGLTTGFAQLSKIATDLGNRLPGNTADFAAMASQLKALGVDTDTLIGGALEAAANLAVVGKPLGVTYDQAAESVGKLSNAFGIAAQDLVPFADTVQRALHLGIDLTQLQYAMARVSGPLKAMGMQGLQVANDMVPLVSMLVQAGVSGEEAGTGIRTMINAQIKAGKFTGVKSLVADLEKMDKLSPADKLAKFTDLFGELQAGKASIIAAGGFAEMVKKMQEQASLQQRVANSLGTLTNLMDAATGSVTNLAAAFADAYAPELKGIATWLNAAAGRAMEWVNANKPMINYAVKLAAAFTGMKLALYGIGIALAFAARFIASLTPLGALLQLIAVAIPLITLNWDDMVAGFNMGVAQISAWLGGLWGNMVGGFTLAFQAVGSAWQGFTQMFPAAGAVITAAVQAIGGAIQSIFGSAIDWVLGKWSALVGAISGAIGSIGSFMSSLGGANVGSMTLPGQGIQRPPINTGSKFSGSLDINHVGAPAGFRAAPVKSRGAPFKVEQNVGYRFSSTGAW